ncbi:MAG: hypothetical protein WCD79_23790, partial [Chthoniobacteraceae bacterium]
NDKAGTLPTFRLVINDNPAVLSPKGGILPITTESEPQSSPKQNPPSSTFHPLAFILYTFPHAPP